MPRALTVFALMIIALAAAAGASAQEEATPADKLIDKVTPAFTCTAQTEGQLTCQANKQCSCAYKPAEAGRPARWAWDCGIMRPRCEVTPADTSEGAYPLPPVIIDQSGDEDEGGE